MVRDPRVVYLGGPIDLSGSDVFHQTVDWEGMGLTAYCPRCECRGLTDGQCIEQNMLMVREAWLAVFNLTSHTIGTPIEMFLRCWIHQKPAIIIGEEKSLFIRETNSRFKTEVVPSLGHAVARIKEISNG